MAANRKCCVPGCDNTRESSVLHKFPNPQNDCNRFRTWTFSIGGNILALDDVYVYNYRRVCHLHFEERYWTRSKMLSKNAVPPLYLKGFVVRKHLADTTNKNYNMEKDYCLLIVKKQQIS
ncbi:unnamed protein product [Leptidea sinapis]|uniref:THAP-type domain-containing protein n=1 Tax=Leptidea sinapis TaxID=189913 RepID=A0A5E4QWY1_9NEOP|nr:unnamed protein product [Leptidea sinapis]